MAYSRISMQALHGQKIGVNCITGQKSGADCILASHLRGFWPKSIPQLQKRRANRISVLYHKPVTWPFDTLLFPAEDSGQFSRLNCQFAMLFCPESTRATLAIRARGWAPPLKHLYVQRA